VPLGLSGAPASYAGLIRMILRGTKYIDNFVDDILAYNENDVDMHLITL